MRKTKVVLVVGSIFVVGAIGCSNTNRDDRTMTSADMSSAAGAMSARTPSETIGRSGGSVATAPATATMSAAGRDPAIVREEERSLSAQNWREVHVFLTRKGYNPGAIDGMAKDTTRQAIMEFQRRNKFAVTGLLDNQTLFEMQKNGAAFTGALGGSLRQGDDDPTTRR